jgi:hypothetical protein
LSYQQSPAYWTVCTGDKSPNEDRALPLLSPTPASALPTKGAKSAKGARMRKVQRDMTYCPRKEDYGQHQQWRQQNQ